MNAREFCIFAVLLVFNVLLKPGNGSIKANLTKTLLANYDSSIIPVQNPGERLTVYYQFTLSSIDNLDEKNQAMTTYGWLLLTWNDPALTWNPADYNGFEYIAIEGKRIWLPEIVLQNGVGEGQDLALSSKFRANVFADGTVLWVPAAKWSTSCNIDLSIFPYDTQVCSVVFMAWMEAMNGDMLFAHNPDFTRNSSDGTSPALLGMYSANEQWELTSSHTWDYDGKVNAGNGQYSTVAALAFTVALRREPRYYLLNLHVPCMTIALASLFIFYLPVESGEKVSYGITMLLSFTLLMVMIQDVTPKGGLKAPFLIYYVVFNMILCGCSLVCTFITLRVQYKTKKKRAPQWLLRLIFCQCKRNSVDSVDDLKKEAAEEEESAEEHWSRVADQLDRVFFYIFVVMFVIVSLLLFIYLAMCANDSSSCYHLPRSIFDDQSRFS